MPEGLSPGEVGKEIGEHGKHEADGGAQDRHARLLSITEAVLLSLVAVLAAYSGYAAAKWSTVSSISLAKASAARTKANRADLEGLQIRTLDSVSFNAWFSAFVAGNSNAELLAEKQLRAGYRPAFRAWLATDPAHNPNAPPGPLLHAAIRDSPRSRVERGMTRRPMPSSRRATPPQRPETSMYATPCSWRAFCSSWASVATSRLVGDAMA